MRAEVGFPDSGAIVHAELAITEEERAKGLSHRTYLAPSGGMLFVLDVPEVKKFWMKDTVLPLDVIFIDSDGQILDICRGEPFSESPFGPDLPVKYVLEVLAGWSKAHGVRVGQRVLLREVRA